MRKTLLCFLERWRCVGCLHITLSHLIKYFLEQENSISSRLKWFPNLKNVRIPYLLLSTYFFVDCRDVCLWASALMFLWILQRAWLCGSGKRQGAKSTVNQLVAIWLSVVQEQVEERFTKKNKIVLQFFYVIIPPLNDWRIFWGSLRLEGTLPISAYSFK